MKKTFKRKVVSGHEYQLLTLPGTNLFKFEIVNLFGSNIERVIQREEGKNVYGISHFIEHLGFRAPRDYTTEELMEALKVHGTYNASTNHDRINYWFRTISEKAEIAINLVCNYALNNLENISAEEFATEKKVVFNEAKRYADDDQTMFYYGISSIVCGYHPEDNIIGLPETIDTFTIEDAIAVKDIFLSTGRNVHNITYDSDVFSEEQVIEMVEKELTTWPNYAEQHDPVVNDMYMMMCRSPENGEFVTENESEQAMVAIIMDAIDDITVARLANMYLSSYSETSLNDIIREQNGLTYGVTFDDTQISYKPYAYFGCDVSVGTEALLMELFEDSINKSADNFNENAYTKLMDTYFLKQTLYMVNQLNYDQVHQLCLWNPEVVEMFKREFGEDIDYARRVISEKLTTYENIKTYIERIRDFVNNKNYSFVTNIQG